VPDPLRHDGQLELRDYDNVLVITDLLFALKDEGARALGLLESPGSEMKAPISANKDDVSIVREKKSRAGRASGIARDEKNKTRDAEVLRLAIRSRKQNPEASQDTVATDVAFAWQLKSVECPGHSTLKGLISEAEHNGKLARKAKR
jgi:hypothetical protein